VRAFNDDNVPHPAGSVDAEATMSTPHVGEPPAQPIWIAVERKLERLIEERKKGGTDKVPE